MIPRGECPNQNSTENPHTQGGKGGEEAEVARSLYPNGVNSFSACVYPGLLWPQLPNAVATGIIASSQGHNVGPAPTAMCKIKEEFCLYEMC